MTEVRFNRGKKYFSLIVTGHAYGGEKGKDLVCGSVSTLVYTLSQYLSVSKKRKMLKKAPVIELESGKAVISCKPKKNMQNYIIEAFTVIQSGFALLAAEYPDNITLYVDNVKMTLS